MKNMKKGFTIVELVIVIAVIAILAAVLIPTFSGVIQKTQQSAALQVATSTMKSTLAMSDYGTIQEGTVFVVDAYDKDSGYLFDYKQNKINALTFSDSAVGYKDKMNSIIVNNANIEDDEFIGDAKAIITKAAGAGTFAAATGKTYAATYTVTIPAVVGDSVTGKYVIIKDGEADYTINNVKYKLTTDATAKSTTDYYTISGEQGSETATIFVPNKTDVAAIDQVWYVFTNTDYAKNVVTFTYSKIAVAD